MNIGTRCISPSNVGGIMPTAWRGRSCTSPDIRRLLPMKVPSPRRCPDPGRPAVSHSANAVLRTVRCAAPRHDRSYRSLSTASSAVRSATRCLCEGGSRLRQFARCRGRTRPPIGMATVSRARDDTSAAILGVGQVMQWSSLRRHPQGFGLLACFVPTAQEESGVWCAAGTRRSDPARPGA